MKDFENFDSEERSGWHNKGGKGWGNAHIWTGLFLLAIGGLALARSFGVPMPGWLFSWQMLLIAIGLFLGLRHGFRVGGWMITILVGGFFLLNEFFMDGALTRHIWPLLIIAAGALFLFRPAGRLCRPRQKKNSGMKPETITPLSEEKYSSDDVINSTCIFSGTKKVILSKDFKGGEMVNIFGGAEIDLTQADIATGAELEVTAIFGGATLIIPSNWAVKSQAVTIFGGINDKRKFKVSPEAPTKTLLLKGTMLFGGLEIKSY